MELNKIKELLLKVEGTRENSVGEICNSDGFAIVSHNGNINFTNWQKNKLFKWTISGLSDLLKPSNGQVFIQNLDENLQWEFIYEVWNYHMDDFIDDVERIQYLTDLKVKLAQKYNDIHIHHNGSLYFEGTTLITTCGDILSDANLHQGSNDEPEKINYFILENRIKRYYESIDIYHEIGGFFGSQYTDKIELSTAIGNYPYKYEIIVKFDNLKVTYVLDNPWEIISDVKPSNKDEFAFWCTKFDDWMKLQQMHIDMYGESLKTKNITKLED